MENFQKIGKMTLSINNPLLDLSLDIMEVEPVEVNLSPFVFNMDDEEEKIFSQLYRALQSNARMKNRIQSLYLAYQMGYFLEEKVLSRIQRALYQSYLTTHYYLGSIRIYYIFQNDISQIFRTKSMTIQSIRHLRANEWKSLIIFVNENN